MLGSDLALLYQVEPKPKALNRAVKRNADRFPEDFIFQLTDEEAKNFRYLFIASASGYGGRRYLPYAFTEHGVVSRLLSTSVSDDPQVISWPDGSRNVA